MSKNKKTTISIVLICLFVGLFATMMVSYAEPTPVADNGLFGGLDGMYNSTEAQDARKNVLNFLKGPLTIFFRILFIGGIILACLMAAWSGKKTWHMFRGDTQKAWNAKEDWKIGIIGAVVISLLMGGGWIGLLKFAESNGIKPLTDVITQPVPVVTDNPK